MKPYCTIYSPKATVPFALYCSNDWNRSCCKPYHPLKLEVRQYIPVGFDGVSNTTEHVWTDVQTSAQDMRLVRSKARQQKQQQLREKERYKSYPVLMTAQWIDGQRCVACPCKWLSTFVCFDFCQDGMHLYAGAIEEEGSGGNDLGRPPTDPLGITQLQSRRVGSAIQPIYGGFFSPTIHLFTPKNIEQPFGKIQGPCLFGGWSDLCFEFQFKVSRFNVTPEDKQPTDLGVIVKKAPTSMAGFVAEELSKASMFSIEFNAEAGLDSSEKATILLGQLLSVYMLFDGGNADKCKKHHKAMHCYCCFYSCFGAVCPVYIKIPRVLCFRLLWLVG